MSSPVTPKKKKLEIAKKYLVPRQRERNGLKAKDINFTSALLRPRHPELHQRSRRPQSGTHHRRSLPQKSVKNRSLADDSLPTLTAKTIEKYLGPVKYMPMSEEHSDMVGRVNGLAWTAVGGEVLDTEAVTIKGKGHLILTGTAW